MLVFCKLYLHIHIYVDMEREGGREGRKKGEGRKWAQTETWEAWAEHQETLLY